MQASSHKPQNMQRPMSKSNSVSTFFFVSGSRSLPTLMSFSGQASAQAPQAVQRSLPFSSFTSRGIPRKRSAIFGRSSGYCSVTRSFGF